MNFRFVGRLVFVSLFVMSFSNGGLFAAPRPQQKTESKADEKKAAEPEWKSLFDGKTLDGWQGAEGLWTVADEAITGTTTDTTGLKANTFLIWKGGEVGDFELKLKFRIEGGNSGVQFRSKDLGDFHVAGYQADIDSGKRYTGILYEERLRGILCERGKKVEIAADGKKKDADDDTFDQKSFAEKVDESKWNDYLIVVKGNQITQTINEIMTASVVDSDPKGAKSGILAFQIHTGPAMKVQFKDVMLKDLSKPADQKK